MMYEDINKGDWVRVVPITDMNTWDYTFVNDCKKRDMKFEVQNTNNSYIYLCTDNTYDGHWAIRKTNTFLMFEKMYKYNFEIDDGVF